MGRSATYERAGIGQIAQFLAWSNVNGGQKVRRSGVAVEKCYTLS